MSDTTPNESHRSLRPLEAVSIGSTALAFAITVWLVTLGVAKEVNPWAAGLLEALGWSATGWAIAGVLAVAVEAACFAYLTRHRDAVPRGTLIGAGLIAAVGLADLGLNLWLVAGLDWSSLGTFYAARYLPAIGAVLVAGLAAFFRGEVRVLAEMLAYVFRDVTSRLSAGETRAILVVALLVVSSVAPLLGGVMPAAADDHTDGDSTLDDFEDGNTNGWTSGITVNSSLSFEGSNSGYVGSAGDTTTSTLDYTAVSDAQQSFYFYYDQGDISQLRYKNSSTGSNAVSWEINNSQYLVRRFETSDFAYQLTDDTWYKLEVDNTNDGDDQVVIRLKDGNGNVLEKNESAITSVSSDVDQFIVKGQGVNVDLIEQTSGVSVSGDITDSDGNDITDATVELRQAGAVQQSTTSDSSGGYSLSGVSDGDYTVRVSADGYQNASKSITVSGSPVTADFSLSGSFTGTVVDSETGDPVADATVRAIGYDFSNYSGTITEKRQQAQDIRDQTFDVEPDAFEQDPTLFDGGRDLQSKDTYAVAHAYADYDAGATPSLSLEANPPDEPDLSPPRATVPSDESLVVSLWDADDGGFAQNAINEELPGSTTGGDVVIERVDASGDPIDRTVATTRDTFEVSRTAAGLATTQHEAVTISDPSPGYYKIYPEGSPAAGYTMAVVPSGGLDELQTQIRTSLERQADAQADELAAQAQALEDEQQAGNISLKSTTTDSNGEFTLALDSSTLQEATVIAYKGPDTPSLPANASRQEIRDYYRDQVASAQDANLTNVFGRSTLAEACGEATDLPAYYRPDGATTTGTPADVTVEVEQVGMPEAVDMAAQQCERFRALQDLRNTSLFDSLPNLAERLQNADAEELERILENARSNTLNNSATCAEATRAVFGEAAPECNTDTDAQPDTGTLPDGTEVIENPTDSGPDYIPTDPDSPVNVGGGGGLTESEVREIVQGLLEADDAVGDTTPTGPPETNVGNETVSVNFPVDADLSDSPGITLTAQYSNGTETLLDQSSEYVSVETNAVGDDVVRVEDYPLGDAAAVTFQLDVATAEDTASTDETVTNPAFDGTLPDLGHLRVSSSEPGVGDTVVVEPGPAPQGAATFGGLEAAQAYAPNGTQLNTTVSDGEAQFSTADVGRHRVELTLSNPGGQTFSETTVVTAGESTTNRPPTLRAQTGALGQYAVATDGLSSGQITTQQAGTRVVADAVIPADADPPSRLHVHEQGVDVQPSHSTQVRVLQGQDRQQVRQRTTVVLHPQTLSDNALIYRNGEPMLQGTGETETVRVTESNGSWSITSPTTDAGVVEIRTVNDPGFIQATIFSIQTSIPDIPIIGWALVPSPGVAAFAVVIIGRRRRGPPGSGGAAPGGEAA